MIKIQIYIVYKKFNYYGNVVYYSCSIIFIAFRDCNLHRILILQCNFKNVILIAQLSQIAF